MSKSTRLSIVWLSTIQGAMKQIKEYELGVEFRQLVDEVYTNIVELVGQWPQAGDDEKNYQWATDRLTIFDQELNQEDLEESIRLMVAIIVHAATELDDKTSNVPKKKLTGRLLKETLRLNDWLDASNYEICVEAERVCTVLDNIVKADETTLAKRYLTDEMRMGVNINQQLA